MSKILYDAHPSMFRTRPFATLLTILLVLGGFLVGLLGNQVVPQSVAGLVDDKPLRLIGALVSVLAVLELFGWWLGTRSDKLTITEHELVWNHGLLYKEYTEVSMASVRTVRVTQTLLQRLMNSGDIKIFTAGDDPELMVRGLPDPNRIREVIKGQAPADDID